MAKNNKNNDVYKEVAKSRLIGCVICLVALLTVFFVGFFVGKSINKNNDVKASTNVTLTSLYVLNGGYTFKNTIDMSTLVPFNNGYDEWDMWFDCDTNGDGILESYSALWAEANYNQTEKYLGYGGGDYPTIYVWDKWGNSYYLNNNISARTIYVDNYETDNSSFYNWFINNTTVALPTVTTYNISYYFNNVIYNGYELPSTVDDDSSYSLKFLTNGIEGYFPLRDYISVNAINCDITNVTYGLDYYPVDGMQYNLIVDINNIIGDVLISFSGESILDNSTVIYTYSNIDSFEVVSYSMNNCNLWKYQDNFIIYPINLNNQYSFTIEISPYADISTPTINIINGGGSVIYDYFTKNEIENVVTYTSNVIIRPNSKGVIIQLRVFSIDYSVFDEIDTSFVSWLGTAVGGFFDFYIMPGLSLGLILGSIIMIGFVIWVIRVFMGG